jgi:CheY-like chemotaxis protein
MQRIRALEPAQGGGVPAVALTAFTAPKDKARALEAGFSMHIAKPVDIDLLVEALAKLAPPASDPAGR